MIQDSGVSVRKRVLKIFKDVCVLQPDCVKVDEICLTILKRIEFEEVSVKVCRVWNKESLPAIGLL